MPQEFREQCQNCGCEYVFIYSPTHWSDWSISKSSGDPELALLGDVDFEELKKELGPGNERWLQEQHLKRSNEMLANQPAEGWSPCPAGGVVNLSASTSTSTSTSTPHRMKMLFQNDSPVLWSSQLPESPVLDSTTPGKSVSSEGEYEEADSSVAFDVDGDRRSDRQRLRAFSTDTSADASWSSSMATPPSTDVKKNPVPEEKDKEKVIARALFSPGSCAAADDDSEAGETSLNTTVEQEDSSVWAGRLSPVVTVWPARRQAKGVGGGGCASCRTAQSQPSPGGDEMLSPCSCGGRAVMEVHCNDDDGMTPPPPPGKASGPRFHPAVLVSQCVVIPETQFTGPEAQFCGAAGPSSPPARKRGKKARCCWSGPEDCVLLKSSPDGDAGSGWTSPTFNTSTPNLKSASCGGHVDAPPRHKSRAVSCEGMHKDTPPSHKPVSCEGMHKDTPPSHKPVSCEGMHKDTPPSHKPVSCEGMHKDTPPSHLPKGGRRLGRLTTKPRKLTDDFASPDRSSVGSALADFFSSPESSLKQRRHAPPKGRQITTASSAADDSGGDEPQADTVCRGAADRQLCESGEARRADTTPLWGFLSEKGSSVTHRGGGKTAGAQGRLEQTGPAAQTDIIRGSSHRAVKSSEASWLEEKSSVKPEAVSGSTLDQTTKRTRMECVSEACTPKRRSSVAAITPSILKSSHKLSQSSQSAKRVWFLDDGLNVLIETPEKRCESSAVKHAIRKETDGGLSLAVKDCDVSETSFDVDEEKVLESQSPKGSTILTRPAPSLYNKQPSETAECQGVKPHAVEPHIETALKVVECQGVETSAVEPDSNEKAAEAVDYQGVETCSVEPGVEKSSASAGLGVWQKRVETASSSSSSSLIQPVPPIKTASSSSLIQPVPPIETASSSSSQTRPVPPIVAMSYRGTVREDAVGNHAKDRSLTPTASTPASSQSEVACAGKAPREVRSVNSHGSEWGREERDAITQSPLTVAGSTVKHGEEPPGSDSKAGSSMTPQSTTQRPMLRVGLKKTPRFLYPSSSQILKSCPQKVFDFASASVGVKQPAVTKAEHHRHENRPGSPVTAKETENTWERCCTSTTAICQSDSPSGDSVTKSPSVEGDPNAVNTLKKEMNSTEHDTSELSVLLEESRSGIEEEADWSDIEDFAAEACDLEAEAKIKGLRLEENLPRDSHQKESQSLTGADQTSISEKQNTCKRTDAASATRECSAQADQVWADCESLVPLGQEGKPLAVRCQPALLTPPAPVVPSVPTPGQRVEESWPPADCGEGTVSDLDLKGSHCALHSEEGHVQGHADPVGRQFQEELQEDLLLGVDFSQELLSQTKPSSLETQGERGAEFSDEATKDALSVLQEISLPSLDKKTASGDVSRQDLEKTTEGSSVSVLAEKETAETFPASIRPRKKPRTDKPRVTLSLEQSNSTQQLLAECRQKSPKSKGTLVSQFKGCGESVPDLPPDLSFRTSSMLTGFRSAAGKVLQPTEVALTSARALFQEDASALDDGGQSVCGEKTSQPPMPAHSLLSDVGVTVSGTVGKESFHGETSFRASSKQKRGEFSTCEKVDAGSFSALPSVCGFKTASGKDFSLPSQYQKKADAMWQAVLKEMQSDTNINNETDVSPDHNSAHAEVNNTVNTSDQTPVPSDAVSEFTSATFCAASVMTEGCAGFKTAGGKAVQLLSKSQQKAAEMCSSVERELIRSDCHPDAETTALSHGKPDPPVRNSPGKCETKDGYGKATPGEPRAEKPVVSLLPSALPARNVPQGFRPFRAPRIVKIWSEEERYTTKVPEGPPAEQMNTILHHFSLVKATGSKNNQGSSEDGRGSKRKLSDEFSDDSDMWGVGNMEEMLNSGFCQQADYQGDEQSSVKHTPVAGMDFTQNPSADFHSGVVSGGIKSDLNTKDSHSHTQQGQSSASVEELSSETVPLAHKKSMEIREQGGKTDDTDQDDEEMSEAVITDLSHDMFEVTDSTCHESGEGPSLQPEMTSALPLKEDADWTREYQDVKLKLPPQGSPKSLAIGNISFESMRCDEDISYDDKDFTPCRVDRGEGKGGDRKEHQHSVTQTEVAGLKAADFDSSFLDPATDPGFGQDAVFQADDSDDDDIESSFVEKDFADMSGLEKDLNASHVEVSGGVVWTDDGHDDTTIDNHNDTTINSHNDIESDSYKNYPIDNQNDTLVDSDNDTLVDKHDDQSHKSVPSLNSSGVREVSHNQMHLEMGDAFDKVRGDMESLDEVFDRDDFDNDPVSSEGGPMLGVHITQIKSELGKEPVGKFASQNNDREPPKMLTVSESIGADIQASSSDSALKTETSEVPSPLDSMCNVSWSDITCTLNPSQWGEVKTCEAGDRTRASDGAAGSQLMDACGDWNTQLPLADHCSQSTTSLNIPQLASAVTLMSQTSGTGKASAVQDAVNVSDTDPDRAGLCSDLVTSDLSQWFSSQMSQTDAEQLGGAGDASSGNEQEPGQSFRGSSPPSFRKGSSSCVSFGFQTAADMSVGVSANSFSLGFQTAAGKSVGVSANSREKVKHLFASEMGDPEDGPLLAPLLSPQLSPAQLGTDNKSVVAPSSAPMEGGSDSETRVVPEVRDMPEISRASSSSSDQPVDSTHGDAFPGTSTDNVSGDTKDIKNPLVTPVLGCFPGFQTAGGAEVSVSKSALAHARSVLHAGEEQAERGSEASQTKEPEEGRVLCAGLRTAGGGTATESATSSRHQLDTPSPHPEPDWTSRQTQGPSSSGFSHAGFQTAGGSKVSVSSKSLQRARQVLKSAEDGNSECEWTSRQTKIPSGVRHAGFQTAGGSKVSVSAKSLQRVRQVLSSAEDGNSGKDGNAPGKAGLDIHSAPRQLPGFETARGRPVGVSESALTNARKMLDTETWDQSISLTGSASAESVSENTRNLRERLDSSNNDGESLVRDSSSQQGGSHASEPRMCGFQTAGGKSVTVSKKSLQHAQTVLGEGENSETVQLMEVGASNPPDFSFQTASGRSVSVSDAAVKQVRSLFRDDTDFHSTESFAHEPSESGTECLPSVKRPESIRDSSPSAGGRSFPPQSTDFHVPTVAADEESFLSAAPPGREASDCVEPQRGLSAFSDQLGRGAARERRSKENLQPVVSDDSTTCSDMTEEVDTADEGHGNSAGKGVGSRVSVKRQAVYADSEVVLHDRLAKRRKLEPVTALDKIAGRGPEPFLLPPRMMGQSRSSTPKGSLPGRAGSSFQPPYKKGKCSPTVAEDDATAADDSGASRMPGFKPPPLANTAVCGTAGSSEPLTTQSTSLAKEPRTAEGDRCPEEEEVSRRNPDACGLVSLADRKEEANSKDRSESDVRENCSVGNDRSESAAVLGHGESVEHVEGNRQREEGMLPAEEVKRVVGQSFAAEEGRMRQEKIIRQKKRQKIRPVQGRWMSQKLAQPQRTLVDLCATAGATSGKKLQRLGVSAVVCSVTSGSAEEFRFYLPSFYPGCSAGLLVGDSAFLLPDAQGYAGKEEFYRAFLTVEGVDPALVTEAWVINHYRWIVWKLAAYEVALPIYFASRALTPDLVMYQLKYRYDREVDCCQRSALKRIVERDDTACKRLVLCISGIRKSQDSEQMMLEVTDGWYCLPCKPDLSLQALIDRRQLRVGQKVMTSGAELAGSQESCSPLELSSGLHLKVHGNSTRPASGGDKLGYQRDPTPLCLPLSTLHPQGGLVGCLDVVVVRKYPLVFMEKQPEGGCVMRTVDMEERVRRRQQDLRQSMAEKLCSQLQAQMEQEEASNRSAWHGKPLKREEVRALTGGAEISDALDTTPHPEEFQSMLSASQTEDLLAYRSKQQEERQQLLNERLREALNQSSSEDGRSVTPLQKFRIVGCCTRDIDSKTDVMLTVWRPGEDWDSVQEGRRYRIYTLTASPPRCRTGGGSVEVSAGRQTRLQALRIEDNLLDLLYEPREVSCVSDMRHKKVPYGEVDFVGLVVTVKTALRGSDAVYAVDPKGDLLLIWFWGGLQAFSLQDSLREGAAFGVSSLRLKSTARDGVVECCASLELSHFSTGGATAAQRRLLQPLRHGDLCQQLLKEGREKLSGVRSSLKPSPAPVSEVVEDLPPSFLDKLLAPLTQEISDGKKHTSTRTSVHTAGNSGPLDAFKTPPKRSLNDSTSSSNMSTISSSRTPPAAKSLNATAAGLNDAGVLSALEQRPLSPTEQEAERKRRAQRAKLSRLASYGRAPALSPLPPTTSSPAAGHAFKAPTPHRK